MNSRAAQKKTVADFLEKSEQLLSRKLPLRERQELENTDPGVPGNLWVSKVEWRVENGPDLKNAVTSTWDHIKYDDAQYYDFDNAPAVSAEWIGTRTGGKPKDTHAPISAEKAFRNLNHDNQTPITVFYIHGGSFVWGSAARSRAIPTLLTSPSHSRAFSVNHRLAPQHPMPAAVLDILTLYFYLVSPPAGSFHDPVPASSIVLAAESSGGALAVAMTLVLLHLRRQNPSNPTVNFNGRTVAAELPAGLALLSPCFDILPCLPSTITHNDNDWIWGAPPWLRPGCPADDIWPSNPPRAHVYCHDTAITHPFLNAAATAPEHLQGFPPVWMSCGEEALSDGVMVFAKHLIQVDSKVSLKVWEGMPHVFALVIRQLPQSRECLAEWALACTNLTKSKSRQNKTIFVEMGELNKKDMDQSKLTTLDLREVRLRMYLAKAIWAGMVWNGPKKGLKLYRPKL